jgi:endonuclease I
MRKNFEVFKLWNVGWPVTNWSSLANAFIFPSQQQQLNWFRLLKNVFCILK